MKSKLSFIFPAFLLASLSTASLNAQDTQTPNRISTELFKDKVGRLNIGYEYLAAEQFSIGARVTRIQGSPGYFMRPSSIDEKGFSVGVIGHYFLRNVEQRGFFAGLGLEFFSYKRTDSDDRTEKNIVQTNGIVEVGYQIPLHIFKQNNIFLQPTAELQNSELGLPNFALALVYDF